MDQGGVYKIVLYENIGLGKNFNSSGSISNITTTGDTITLTDCEILNYQAPFIIGENRDLMYSHRIDFSYYELIQQTYIDVEQLNNIFGWVAKLFFRNEEIFVCETPLFYPVDEIGFNTNNTNTFNLHLTVQVPTNKKLTKYDEQGQEILSEADVDILAEDGSSVLTG